ncbi:MAG: hypothetical protein ACM3S4_04125 [Burkholderiales bacterium]
MKTKSLLLFIIVLAACVCLCAGCIVVKPEGTGAITSDKPAKSDMPATSGQQTASPQTSGPSDIEIVASFTADINGDNTQEKISVGLGKGGEILGNEIIVSVSGSEASYNAVVDSGYFESANLTETPNGAPCLVISTGYEGDDYSTVLCSFDGLKPVVSDSVNGKAIEVSYTSITVDGYVDALGTWFFTCLYDITDDFKFEAATDMMIDMTDRDPLVTKASIPVEILEGGEYFPGTIDPGTKIYPAATDGASFVFFRLDDGTEGKIIFTRDGYESFIGGVSENDCFESVPYVG